MSSADLEIKILFQILEFFMGRMQTSMILICGINMKRATQRRLLECINFGAKSFDETYLLGRIQQKTKFEISKQKVSKFVSLQNKISSSYHYFIFNYDYNKVLVKDKSDSSWKV